MTATERSIDEYRPIKVVCIGAGVSGILAAIRYEIFRFPIHISLSTLPSFPQKVPNIHLTVYEKEKGIGGTWLNKYPVGRESSPLCVPSAPSKLIVP